MRHGRDTAESTAGLVSGEAVHLEVRLARAGSRVPALLIDIVAQVMVFFLLVLLLVAFFGITRLGDAASSQASYIIALVLTTVGYPTLLLVLTRGRSLGKLAMGLRVVRDDGGPITLRQSLTRALVGATLEWPGLLLIVNWAVSLVVLTGSPRGKRLADVVAGTIVIHDRSPQGWGWVPTTPPPLARWASTLDLTGLDDELALAARHFLARSRGLSEPYRTRLGHALATEIATCVTPAPPPDTPGWAYLAGVIGERHRRASQRLARDRASHAMLWPELFAPVPAPAPVPVGSGTGDAAPFIPVQPNGPAADPRSLRPATPV
ncbi:RDD family protein [Catellatospora paridis]|uniref:RDD family protein n=1 Tax=Catellatospora paridis TaxID=1617086 RepID=UPI0012D3BEE0|nr:RDD family protein [Catellatospora paridis]